MRWISAQVYEHLLQQYRESVDEANDFRLMSWELVLRVEKLEMILLQYGIPSPSEPYQDGTIKHPYIVD